MNFGIFKKFNHRKFNYTTRYYDKEKEKLDAIVGKYNKDIDQTELRKRRISSGFASKKSPSIKTKNTRQANIRLLIIIALLSYISYMFLTSDKFFKILEAFS